MPPTVLTTLPKLLYAARMQQMLLLLLHFACACRASCMAPLSPFACYVLCASPRRHACVMHALLCRCPDGHAAAEIPRRAGFGMLVFDAFISYGPLRRRILRAFGQDKQGPEERRRFLSQVRRWRLPAVLASRHAPAGQPTT